MIRMVGATVARRLASAGAPVALVPDASSARKVPPVDFRALRSRLRKGGLVTDSEFDEVYPSAARKVSSEFWTPVAVASRAAKLLVRAGASRVLDVGSGVGKFCIVGAVSTTATFVGVEHREHFVAVAQEAARRIGAPKAHFVHGALDAVDLTDFDAFYFFNPFEENLWGPGVQLDQTVPLSEARFTTDVERAKWMLVQARVGTRVVTYHGLGDALPPGYVLARRQLRGCLDLWIKTTPCTRPRSAARGTALRSS